MDGRELILPHRDLRVHFFYQIEDDGDDDKNGCAAQGKSGNAGSVLHNERQNCDKAQKYRAEESDAG